MDKLNDNYTEDYKLMINDLIKIITVFLVSNILMFLGDTTNNKLFGASYMKLMVVVVLGFVTYWLVVKNLVIV